MPNWERFRFPADPRTLTMPICLILKAFFSLIPLPYPHRPPVLFSWQESIHTSHRLQKQDWHVSVEKVCKTLKEGECKAAPTAPTWDWEPARHLRENKDKNPSWVFQGTEKLRNLPQSTQELSRGATSSKFYCMNSKWFCPHKVHGLCYITLQKVSVKWMFLFREKVLQCQIILELPALKNQQLQDFQRKSRVATLKDLTKVSPAPAWAGHVLHHKVRLLSGSSQSCGEDGRGINRSVKLM